MPLPGSIACLLRSLIGLPLRLHCFISSAGRNAVVSTPFLPSAPAWHFAKGHHVTRVPRYDNWPTGQASNLFPLSSLSQQKRQAPTPPFPCPHLPSPISLSLSHSHCDVFLFPSQRTRCVPSPPPSPSFPPPSRSYAPSPAPSPGYHEPPPAPPSSHRPTSNALK